MEVVTKKKLIDAVTRSLKKTGVEKKYYDSVEFIVERYLYYMKLALIHGYKQSAARIIKFSLVYTYFKIVPSELKNILIFPSRAFGYAFHINVESSRMKKSSYIYKTDDNFLKVIADNADGDNVYKLINQ